MMTSIVRRIAKFATEGEGSQRPREVISPKVLNLIVNPDEIEAIDPEFDSNFLQSTV